MSVLFPQTRIGHHFRDILMYSLLGIGVGAWTESWSMAFAAIAILFVIDRGTAYYFTGSIFAQPSDTRSDFGESNESRGGN